GENVEDRELVWTSEEIEITEAGEYLSEWFETQEALTHGFVERTYDAEGRLISEGEPGDPTETIEVGDREVTVTTQVQFEGDGDRPGVGDEIWDEVLVEGDV